MRVIVSAKRLRILRAEGDLSQHWLAYEAGINRAVISRLEANKGGDMKVSNLYLLVKALSRICQRPISMEDLIIEMPDGSEPQVAA